MPVPDLEQLKRVIAVAATAVSGDNSQPWKFLWDGCRLQINCDPARDHFAYDADSESVLISFGALLENLSLALGREGFGMEVELLPKGKPVSQVAVVSMCAGGESRDPLAGCAAARCVNRRMYSRRPVPQDQARQLIQAVEQNEDVRVSWVEDRRSIAGFADLVSRADRMIWEHPGLFGDLRRWLRIGPNAGESRDGMPLRVLGLGFPERLMMTWLDSFEAVLRLNRLGFSRIAAFKSRRWVLNSGAVAVFTIRRTEPTDFIAAGRCLQRFWIKANALGVAVQPMSAWVFLLNHLRVNGAKDFSAAQRDKITAIKQSFEALMPELAGEEPIMFLRLGYAPPPPFRTLRLPVEDVLEVKLS